MSAPSAIVATDWKLQQRKSLQGFCNLHLPSGLVIHDVALHQRGEVRWLSPPGRPQIDKNGELRRDPQTRKILYTPTISFADGASRDRFQRLALEAVDRLLDGGAP